jgi:hypothetical protein
MRLSLLLVAAVLVALLTPASAQAECERNESVQLVQGVAQVIAAYQCDSGQGAQQPVGDLPPRVSGLDALCVQEALTHDVDPFLFCDLPAQPVATQAITPGLVAAAFRRIPLPPADLVIQPPNGRTLVNFETNFYTEQGEFTRTVTLLGRQVELRIWPASFRWQFGDGESTESTSPGAAYPKLEITHAYEQKGPVSPSVDTTYAAQFRVEGGPWRDVGGTVTIPGSPQGLRVVEARPVLVGG